MTEVVGKAHVDFTGALIHHKLSIACIHAWIAPCICAHPCSTLPRCSVVSEVLDAVPAHLPSMRARQA